MSNNNRNNRPDNDETGEVMSWVIIFILMVAFWPVGLILLLKKLNVFTRSAKSTAARAGKHPEGYARGAWSESTKAAREAEAVAREAASEIAQAAREAGHAARQAISEIYADISRDFSQTGPTQPSTEETNASRPGTWKSATSQSQTWQSMASKPGQSVTSQPQPGQGAAPQPRTPQSAISWVRSGQEPASQSKQAGPGAARSQDGRSNPPQTRTARFNDPQARSGQSAAPDSQSAAPNAPPVYVANSRKTKAKIKKERTALEKKSGRFVSVVLLLISIALFILGANTIAGAARDIWGNGVSRWPDFYLGVFYLVGGFISFFSRNVGVRRFARYKRYSLFVSGRDAVPIQDITRTAGLSERVVKRDIQAMINEGYLDRKAYIDKELNCLFLTPEAADEAHRAAKAAGDEPAPAVEVKHGNQFMMIMLELREINNSIADISISNKASRIEELTAKIFRIVEENPEKSPQIRRFMNYYIPTTLKLLRSYATLEKQGVGGENITTTKESIERILDTLATGFEQQLDQLFSADALDIAADINVLENMMQQDGLTSNKSVLETTN